jgi:phosphonate transport system substrate-binding protein
MQRRDFMRCVAALPLLTPLGAAAGTRHAPLRIGLTPVFLDDQAAFLQRWRSYLGQRLDRPVSFVQRSSYREIVEQLVSGAVDVSWVCGYPYVLHREQMRLLAVPLYRGRPLYQSYLIVSASDSDTHSLAGLRNRVFAYADPLSNSGWLVPQAELRAMGEDPARFFRRSFFTWAHRKVVEAVAVGLAHGGAVDGYIWDALSRLHPELTERTRVVQRSNTFGFPPVVARAGLDEATFSAVRRVMLDMGHDDEGRSLLAKLYLDGFDPGHEALFAGIGELMRRVERA